MNNLSRQLETLFVDLENKLPTFDDDDELTNVDNASSEIEVLEAAYPSFYQNLKVGDDFDIFEAGSLNSSPRSNASSPRKAVAVNPEPRVTVSNEPATVVIEWVAKKKSADACVGNSDEEGEVKDNSNGTANSPRRVPHDELFPSIMYPSGTNFTADGPTRSQIESQELVEKYFPTSSMLLSSGGVEMEDLDQILESLEEHLDELGVPDNFQQLDMLVPERNEYRLLSNNQVLPGAGESGSTLVLEKLILHAAKYDETLKLKDFDLRNGALKSNKRNKPRREKHSNVQEAWTDAAPEQLAESTTCNRGVSACFPLADSEQGREADPPTVYVDLRINAEEMEKKRRSIQRIQSILGIQPHDSDSDSD